MDTITGTPSLDKDLEALANMAQSCLTQLEAAASRLMAAEEALDGLAQALAHEGASSSENPPAR